MRILIALIIILSALAGYGQIIPVCRTVTGQAAKNRSKHDGYYYFTFLDNDKIESNRFEIADQVTIYFSE